MLRRSIPATLVLGLCVIFSSPLFGQGMPKTGQPYPDFALPNIEDGKLTRLSDYRGKKVLLIHFASW